MPSSGRHICSPAPYSGRRRARPVSADATCLLACYFFQERAPPRTVEASLRSPDRDVRQRRVTIILQEVVNVSSAPTQNDRGVAELSVLKKCQLGEDVGTIRRLVARDLRANWVRRRRGRQRQPWTESGRSLHEPWPAELSEAGAEGIPGRNDES